MSRAEIEKITNLPYAAWVEPHDSRQIVLSSRLRLARNLAGRPFHNSLDDTAAAAFEQEVADCLPNLTPENDLQIFFISSKCAIPALPPFLILSIFCVFCSILWFFPLILRIKEG